MLPLENSNPTLLHRDLIEHKPGEPDRGQLDPWLRTLFPEQQITWSQILQLENESETFQPVLFTAPSGSGKSTEFHFLVRLLRQRGKVALAVEARRLAAGDLESALDPDECTAWEGWKSRPIDQRQPIYLLVDAVDELYLGSRNLQDLWAALRGRELLGPKVRLVVSSRDDTWGPRESQWLHRVSADLQASFESSKTETNDSATKDPFVDDAGESVTRRAVASAGSQKEKGQPSTFRHIKLAFLAPQQVLVLAALFGLEHCEGEDFLGALNAAEVAGLFPFRPRDVKTLVGYWQAHRNFDSWTAVLDWQVRNAYQEFNPERGRHRELSLERFTEGIRRIAAVTTLSDVRHVLRPDSSTVKGAPHAEDLFPEWKPGELKELFASPLLVRKGPASQDNTGVAVQIVQGQFTDYLAALWAKSVYFGGAEEAVLKSIFVAPPQHELECVPEERRSMAGWLAGMLPQVRKQLLGVAPEIALYRGDPACLSVEEVRQALEAVVQRPSTGRYEYGSAGQLARIARAELSGVVVEALTMRGLPDHMIYELLQIARQGAFRAAVAPALHWARDDGADEYTRKRAVELVAELGVEDDKLKLLTLLGTDASPVRSALFRALVPSHLSGKKLIDFLAREGKGDIVSEIQRQGLPLSSAELCELGRILTVRLLKTTKAGASDCAYEDAEDGTASLALEVLKIRANDPRPLEPEFRELAIRIESHELHVYIDQELEQSIRGALCQHHWESIWDARLQHDPIWDQRFRLCPIIPERFEWVIEKLGVLGSGSSRDHLEMWGRDFLDSLADEELTLLRVVVSPRSAAIIDRRQEYRILRQEEAHFREDEREREKEEKRNENDAELRPQLHKIRSGEHEGALHWAYGYFPEFSFSRAGKLHEVVSSDVADALTEGFRNWWRKSDPSPDAKDTTHGEAWGLVGISLEISAQGFQEIKSDEEVRAATRLALRGLNSAPEWLTELHALHPVTVEDTLRQAIVGAWGGRSSRTSFMSHLHRLDAPRLIDSVAGMIFSILRNEVPESASTLEDAIDLALRASAPPKWLSSFAAQQAQGAPDTEFRKQWLRLWCHAEGAAAASWLIAARKSDPSWDQATMEVCRKIEWDLHRDRPAKWSTFFSTESLRCWLPLLVQLAPPRKALRRPGRNRIAVPWGPVDHTREVLEACEKHLVSDGSVHGTNALKALSVHQDNRVSEWALRMLPFQRLKAAKTVQETWDVDKILEAERFARRLPLTTAELCDVVLGEIRRVDNRMREGDFAYPEFFTDLLSENDIQRWVAAQLELVGKRSFYVGREGEVKDRNKMDIVAIRPSLGRVPIEIKPIFESTKYSLVALEKTIDEQLVGKYMRPADVTHGVLLLVRLVERQWEIGGQLVDFAAGVNHLRSYARQHERFGKVVAVAVIDIETARSRATKQSSV